MSEAPGSMTTKICLLWRLAEPVLGHAELGTNNHSNKNRNNNCCGDKQSNSQTLILLTAIPHKETYHHWRNGEPTDNYAKCYLGNQFHGDEGHRFDLRFLRPLRADLSITKSSSFFPPLMAATSQRGLAPRPAQVSPDGLRYFGGTFFPFNALPRLALRPPAKPPTAFEVRPDVCGGFPQSAPANPLALQRSSLTGLSLA